MDKKHNKRICCIFFRVDLGNPLKKNRFSSISHVIHIYGMFTYIFHKHQPFKQENISTWILWLWPAMAVQGLQFHCEAFAFCVPSRSASHRVLPDCSTGWDVVRYPPGNDRNGHIIPFQAVVPFEDVVPFPKVGCVSSQGRCRYD